VKGQQSECHPQDGYRAEGHTIGQYLAKLLFRPTKNSIQKKATDETSIAYAQECDLATV